MKQHKDTEKALGLKGSQVVALNQGKILGHVEEVYLNQLNGGLSELGIKESIFGQICFVAFDDVERIGEDIIFVKSKDNMQEIATEIKPKGQNLKSLQGMWVTSQDGEHFGLLADVDFDHETWLVTALLLSDGRKIPLDGGKAVFGKDEIIVSSALKQTVRPGPAPKMGFLAKMLSFKKSRQISDAIKQKAKVQHKAAESAETSVPSGKSESRFRKEA